MHFITKPKYLLLLILLFIAISISGQTEVKNWDGINLDLALSKKAELGFNHMRSYIMTDSFRNNFNQWGIDMDYRIAGRFSARAGYRLTRYPLNSVSTNRYQLRATYRTALGKKINWANSFQAELHSANENRFRSRYIFETRLSPQKRLKFLRLSPSVSYWLYYNNGGNSIQYFDDFGLPVEQHSPDGFHRGRLIINLNSKINNNVAVSVYFMNQREFNLTGNDMNILNPVTGRIERPFDNYSVAGLSLSLDFDLYRKKSGNPGTIEEPQL